MRTKHKSLLILVACAVSAAALAETTSYHYQKAVPQLVVDSGIPPAPLAKWASPLLEFSGVPVGSSATRTVALRNVGTAVGNFSQMSGLPEGLQADASSCATVAVGAECLVRFTFTPSGMTAMSAPSVSPFGSNHENVLAVSGLGLLTAGSLSTSSLQFADQLVGSTSAVQTVGLTNAGNTPLSVGQLSVSGPFLASTDCASSLAAGSLCHINVQFKPVSSGSFEGVVTLQSSAGTQTVALTGSGVAAVLGFEDALGSSLAQLTYSTALGTTAPAQTLYVKNKGTAPLLVSSVSAPTPFAVTSSSCSAALAPGARCPVSVSFTPAAQTTYSLPLSVASNALTSAALTLNGTGGPPSYAILSLATAKVPTNGTLSADKLTLSPTGGGNQILVSTNLAAKTSGKWYFEAYFSNIGCTFCELGVMPASAVGAVVSGASVSPVGYAYTYSGGGGSGGGIGNGMNSWVATGLGQTSGTRIGVALDLDAHQVTFKLSGATYGPYNLSSPRGTAYVPFVTTWGSYTMTANFGQSAFVRGVPAGYNAGWY